MPTTAAHSIEPVTLTAVADAITALEAAAAALRIVAAQLDDATTIPAPLPHGLVIDAAAHTVTVGTIRVDVTRLEWLLLNHLASDPTRVFDKAALLRTIWGVRALTGSRIRTLDSHACRLRTKLAAADPTAPWIHNVWGQGYALTSPNA